MSKQDLSKPESRNWLKQWRAVYITRQALLPTVSEEANQLHKDILDKAPVPSCTTCFFEDVQKKNASCKFHLFFRDELVNEHAYKQRKGKGKLALKNTKAERWDKSPWEIAKVFMPPSGYENKTTIDETDFNGIAGFIINCERFNGKITGSICEKARESVNRIRHMPDLSSSDLTDQATTDCIDNLYALLNGPALKTRPEVVQACKELDELKTSDPSKDENTYKYIIKEILDGFGQRLADIEMQLQTQNTDTKRAKENLHTYTEALKKNYDDAMHALSTDKGVITLAVKEEGKKFIDSITSIEQNAAEHIEKYVTDGKRTLERLVNEGIRRAKEEIEHFATSRLEDPEERLRQSRKEQEEEALREKRHQLKAQLLEHYRISSRQMTVRLDIDGPIEKIYEKPKLAFITLENGETKEVDIPEVSQLFSTGDDPMAKMIIVEGEPGTGKTSLCKKIVHEWRKANENVEEPIESNLSKFKFVFYIILRDVKTESEIKKMIVQHILKKIDSDYENEHSVLGNVLKSKHCLLLLDGLDEWNGKMPHVETSWTNCTTLITTRPYKLADLKVSQTRIDKHVKLSGVQDPKSLLLRTILKLEETNKTNKDPKSCIRILEIKGLRHFKENPFILVYIVWLWHKNKMRKINSRSALYQKILDERWHDLCDKNETDIDQQKLFDVLSEIAFDKLFSENEDESLLFNIEKPHLETFKQFKEASLESGILSSSKECGERFPQYHFLHKTFQEYLAAVFLSKCGSELSSSCKLVKNIHSNHRNESVFALEQVFIFLCGLNPKAAEQFSKTLNELFTENCEETGSAREANRFQSMILEGYDEAERNRHVRADFCLQHVNLSNNNWLLTESQRLKIKLCLHDRKSSLVSLSILGKKDLWSTLQDEDDPKSSLVSLPILEKNDVWSTLQYKDDPTVLDLLSYKNLKFVELDDPPFEDINLLNLNGLVLCDIRFKDYKQASKLVASVQSSDLRCLKHLVLKNVGLECEAVDILSKLKRVKELDLTWSGASRLHDSPFDFEHLRHLEDLNSLTLREFPFFDVVVHSQLRKLERLHIGFRTQQRVPKLMTALLQEGDDSLTAVPKGPHFILRDLTLGKVRMSAEVYRRLVSMVLQSKDRENFIVDMCTIEEDITQVQEEMGNQPSLQMVPPQAALTYPLTFIGLWNVSMPAEFFRRLVIMVLQSRRIVTISLEMCIIEDDIKQGQEEMGNQPALQVVAPQAASKTINIDLLSTPVSGDVFMRLVSAIQSRNCIMLQLEKCTIKEDIKQAQEEIRNKHARRIKSFRSSSDSTTYIELLSVTVSAEVFWRFVSEVFQLVRSLNIRFKNCTLEEDITQVQEESALQVVIPQAASTDYTTYITLENMTVSAKEFRRLVSVVFQSGHSANFRLDHCKIEENITQEQDDMGNQSALPVMAPKAASTDYKKYITLIDMTMSAEVFRHLLSVVIQSGHIVACSFLICNIKPEEEVIQLQAEMENQPAIQVNEFRGHGNCWYIQYKNNV